ncbi:lantibiotic dehydratase C-terminal domain-containing protein [Actinomycetes bacterium KLBMP 9759]
MTSWTSLHVFHQGGQDRLIAEGIVPELVAQHEAGLLDDWFFLRYWDGGPHVRVRTRPAAGRAAEATERLRAALAGYLAANPSTAAMPRESYLVAAELMARQEGMTDFCREPYPPDSVVEIAYRPETHVYGTGPSLRAVERHFATSSRLAADVLATGVPPGRRRGLVLSMTVLTLAVLRPDASELAGSPPPTLPAAVGDHPDTAPPPEELDRIRDHISRLWSAACSEERAESDAGGLLSGWLAAARELHAELTGLATDGLFDVEPPRSPLFWCLRNATAAEAVLARCTHLIANRLGVPVADEISLNLLIARAVATRVPTVTEGVGS